MNAGDSFASRAWSRRSVPWAGALFIAAIAAAAVFDIVRGYQATVADTGRELETQAHIIAEQTARSLQAVDVVLRHVAQQYRTGKLAALGPRELHLYLQEQAVGLAQIEGIGVRDAKGELVAASFVYPVPESMLPVADRFYFHRLRDDPAIGLFVGDALKSRVTGGWVFPIVRRLETATGEFAGFVGGPGRVAWYQQFYRDIQLDAGTTTTLMHRTGTLLARYPPVEAALGKRFPLLDEMLAARAAGTPGPTRTRSPVDGVERFGAVRPVPDYPLEVVVTREVSVALAPWRQQAIGTAVRTLALGILAALLLAVAMRQFARLYASREALHQSEEALRTSEERYQLAVAGSNEGLWDWDLASDALFLSPRAQELLGMVPGEPLGTRREWIGRARYHPDDRPGVRRATAEHLRGATPHFEVEYRMGHSDGTWHWYRQRGVALRDGESRPYRMAGSMEDITDRKNAEMERARLEGQLRQAQKLEAMGTLAGGIAHDFNNILSAILGYGEMAQKEAAPGTPLRRHVEAALAAALRAKSLVERILAFSRAGMGERVPVHVQAVVAEVLDQVTASLPAGVALESELAAGNAAVLGDPTQIHQVVMNLCANAVHAMKGGGRLKVRVAEAVLAEPRAVSTSVLPAGCYVAISVADSGSGIEPKVLERIFDPFFTTREVGVGTGLGLSLVHGIVTDLGGGVEVESRVGEGSRFTVFLPCHGTAAAPAPEEAAIPGGCGETILFVDDEEALVRLGEEMLAGLGYEPVGFVSSAAALESFRAAPRRFDAVLSDEAMPGMTGSELVREIRRIRPEIPVALMSGYVTPALTARARDAGVAEVLAKPLVARDIARSLANALHH